MTHAASSTYDEVTALRPTRETRIVECIAAPVLWYRGAVSRAPTARERYLEAAINHVDVERRREAWDAHEQAALRRLATGLY